MQLHPQQGWGHKEKVSTKAWDSCSLNLHLASDGLESQTERDSNCPLYAADAAGKVGGLQAQLQTCPSLATETIGSPFKKLPGTKLAKRHGSSSGRCYHFPELKEMDLCPLHSARTISLCPQRNEG